VTASRKTYAAVLSVTLSLLDVTPLTNVKRNRLPNKRSRTPKIAMKQPQPRRRLLAFGFSSRVMPSPGIFRDHT
jgi:hypothetical protein